MHNICLIKYWHRYSFMAVLAYGLSSICTMPALADTQLHDLLILQDRQLQAGIDGTVTVSWPPGAGLAGLNLHELLGADAFYLTGITGQNADIANVEGGHVWNGHISLSNIASFVHHSEAWGNNTNDLIDRHATWVGSAMRGTLGGTLAERGPHQLGIAYGSNIYSGAIATSWVGNAFSNSYNISLNSFKTPYVSFFGQRDVINSSYGYSDPAAVDGFTMILDGLANANPQTLFVTAAGNSGTPNTVTAPASAYNNLSVGATGLQNDRFEIVASFSSRGPQDWGYRFGPNDADVITVAGVRAPVDLVAPGERLNLAYYGGRTGGNNPTLPNSFSTNNNNLYSIVSGTSFAAPLVSGAAALMHSYAQTVGFGSLTAEASDARVIQAVLQNSASKIPGWNNAQTMQAGILTTTQSMDYAAGTGQLNIGRAYAHYTQGASGFTNTPAQMIHTPVAQGWDLGTLNTAPGYDRIYMITDMLRAGNLLSTTLVWYRERAYDDSLLTVADLFEANLNLYVFKTDITGTMIGDVVAQSVSQYNLVEHLYFQIPEQGYYGIGIEWAGNHFTNGIIPLTQTYALAWAVIPEPATFMVLTLGSTLLFRRRR